MRVHSIQVQNFRNLQSQSVELSPAINLLLGDNGQGKTNFLEALHVLATLRSFRTSSLRELIAHEARQARMKASVDSDGMPLVMRLNIEAGGRQLWLGEKSVRQVGDYLGRLNMVAFTPDDLSMIKGAPSLRRRFIDRACFLFRPAHLQVVRDFSSALRARNRLLQESHAHADPLLLESFGETLAENGSKLSANRAWLIDMLAPKLELILKSLTGGSIEARIRFSAGWKTDESYGRDALLASLTRNLERDRRRGSTSAGPQLDDLDVELNGASARHFASQGQQRAVAVALMLAVVETVVDSGGESPIILLDDVSSELDADRRARLFDWVIGFGGQVLVTATEMELVEALRREASKVMRVREGQVLDWVEGE